MPLRVVLKLNVRNLNQFPLWPHAENYVPSVGNVYTREQKPLFENRLLLALQFVALPRLPVPVRGVPPAVTLCVRGRTASPGSRCP